jgi:transposase
MTAISTIGLDLAKNVFQVHGVDAHSKVMVRKALKRNDVLSYFAALPQPCLVGMEACGTAHHWARELTKLGHTVKLMPAAQVKAYLKRGKTDAADAQAICEAVTRPSMREVPVKSIEQQSVLMLHRSRELLVSQRTQTVNAMRAHLAELGIIAATGILGATTLVALVRDKTDARLPPATRVALMALVRNLESLSTQIATLDRALLAAHKANEASRRLEAIPGVGPLIASAFTASVGNAENFASARGFANWLGLTPSLHGTGGKTSLGGITKQGDHYLRKLLVVGATAVVARAKVKPADYPWLTNLLGRLEYKEVAVALANKNARIIWALLTSGSTYTANHRPAAYAAA